MYYFDDWHDFVRAIAFVINAYSLYLSVIRYRAGIAGWTSKTIDLWYALTMWILAGAVFSVQGIILDRPFTPGFVFLTAASLVSGKGLRSKGPWGGHDT